jgi:CDP-diacylglycerol--serine O-phosphatidyltransferase
LITGVDLNVNSPLTKNFFLGVPAPAGSLLVLLPLICYFQFKAAVFADPYYVSGWTVFVAYLLVARIPTFSSKMTAALFTPVSLPKLLLITVIAAALLVSLALHLWLTLLSLSLLYVLSFPFSFAAFLLVARNIKKNSKNS